MRLERGCQEARRTGLRFREARGCLVGAVERLAATVPRRVRRGFLAVVCWLILGRLGLVILAITVSFELPNDFGKVSRAHLLCLCK